MIVPTTVSWFWSHTAISDLLTGTVYCKYYHMVCVSDRLLTTNRTMLLSKCSTIHYLLEIKLFCIHVIYMTLLTRVYCLLVNSCWLLTQLNVADFYNDPAWHVVTTEIVVVVPLCFLSMILLCRVQTAVCHIIACLFVCYSTSHSLPLFEEICKRSACFLISVFFAISTLVWSVISYSINFGRYNSLIYRNLCTVYKLFNWLIHDCISDRVCLSQRFFTA